MDLLHRTWAQIDLSALAENFRILKKLCNRQIYPVVKANAYGHGMPELVKPLERYGADGFAVSNLAEALDLRAAGTSLPILILGYTPAEYADILQKERICQCVYSLEYAQALSKTATAPVQVHLKLDTGMGRLGFDCRSDALPGLEEAAAVLSLPNLLVDGVFTHFAVADEPGEQAFTQDQCRRFHAAVAALEATGHTFAMKHCNNSAGILTLPHAHLDMVRAGIALYGIAPSGDVPLPAGFRPVMSLHSVVSMVKTVAPGETVSYGRTYRADSPRRIATVSAGYADGIPRLLSGKGHVLVHGQRAPIVGTVCMDQFCIDVTDIPGVTMGDYVTVFGQGLPVEEVALAAQTIPYEILCGISKRVPRLYTE